MTKEQAKKRILEVGKKFQEHSNQMLSIGIIVDELIKVSNRIIKTPKKAPFRLSEMILSRITVANIDIIYSLANSLNEKNYTSTEVLSRVSIEYSINSLFILKKDSEIRAKGYLNQYLNHHSKKLNQWNKNLPDFSEAKDFSDKCIDDAENVREIAEAKFQLGNEKWPNTFDKFRECGLECDYQTLYRSASDAIHATSEDIFNYVFSFSLGSDSFGQNLREAQISEKQSFAIYLSLHSLRYFAFVIGTISEKASFLDEEVNDILKRLEDLLRIHETEIKEL